MSETEMSAPCHYKVSHGGYPGTVETKRSRVLQLDTVVTVAIGDMNANGVKFSDADWRFFQEDTAAILHEHGTVVASTYGAGVTSDQPDETVEGSAVWIALIPEAGAREAVRRQLAAVLRTYGASSAAMSVDTAHEPVFATNNGYRKEV